MRSASCLRPRRLAGFGFYVLGAMLLVFSVGTLLQPKGSEGPLFYQLLLGWLGSWVAANWLSMEKPRSIKRSI